MGVGDFTQESYSIPDTVFSIVFFMFASAGMSIVNKLAVTALPVECTLVGIQMLFTVLFVVPKFFMKPTTVKDEKTGEERQVKAIEIGEWVDCMWFAPCPIFLFAGMLLSSMFAYSYNTIATIVVFRNLSPIFSMAAEMAQNNPLETNWKTYLALTMAVVGCILFGHDSIQLTQMGLISVMLNLVIATTERVFVRWVMKKKVVGADGTERQLKIDNAGMMFYQNSLGMLPAALLVLAFGEYKEYAGAFTGMTSVGIFYVFLSCVVGVAISYAGFRLQRRISATSFLVTTNTNKMAVLGFGAFVLKDKYTPISFLGCVLAMSSALVYAKASRDIAAAKAKKEEVPASITPNAKTPLLADTSRTAAVAAR